MNKRRGILLSAAALMTLALLAANSWREQRISGLLLRAEPSAILADPALLQQALEVGRPLYRKRCATCHGVALEGKPAQGVPNLAANAWLYGNDPVAVEHTILYGIRSGNPNARNVTDMPALVRSGQLDAGDAKDAVEYIYSLAGIPHDGARAEHGREIYFGAGNCFDCHSSDASGNTDYGTPPLTGPIWLYGGDRETLYESVLNGRHGICPAWIDKLSALQIRSLTVYLVSVTRGVPAAALARP